MPENYRRDIPNPGRPELGRNVNHDPRSLAYKVIADGTVASARWERQTPVLDQGDLGSCTGNAACGALGTSPFRATLASSSKLDEAFAVQLYSAATKLDDYKGTYPPTDTGSDGLSVAKACKAGGYISGYLHITSIAAAQTAIQSGPFIVGTEWRADMDNPDTGGIVHATGTVRGGHEYECIGFDAVSGFWEFVNSWGSNWAKGGHFFYSTADLANLLAADGDGTVFVPLTSPAPVPTPTPVPVTADAALVTALGPWSLDKHSGKNAKAAAAFLTWRAAKGL